MCTPKPSTHYMFGISLSRSTSLNFFAIFWWLFLKMKFFQGSPVLQISANFWHFRNSTKYVAWYILKSIIHILPRFFDNCNRFSGNERWNVAIFRNLQKFAFRTDSFENVYSENVKTLYFWNQLVEIYVLEFFRNFLTTFFKSDIFPRVSPFSNFGQYLTFSKLN